MRWIVGFLFCAITLNAHGQSLSLHGFITGREIYVKSQPSWTEGGFGRFDVGARNVSDRRTVNADVAQLGLDWTPATWLLVHADGIARKEPSGTRGSRAGVVQAFVELHSERWRLRGGAFWLPTSRENIDPLWNSPYSITYSALNSWIGQEVRPIGIDVQYSPNFYLTAGATAFRGNDTMGTELASHGWTVGNRLTVYNESLPLSGESATTKPVWRDLDGRNGYAERIRVQLPERAMIQVTHIDNRAELVPELKGQTPWLTRFNVIGGTLGLSSPTTIAAEWASGWTELAFPGGTSTMDFDTAYVLVSRKSGANRSTVRVERFSTRDRRRRAVDDNREHGNAVTVSLLHDVSEHMRAGLEYVKVKGERPLAASFGLDPNGGGSTITVELRYGF